MPYSIGTNIILFAVVFFGVPLLTKCIFVFSEYFYEKEPPFETIKFLIENSKEQTFKISAIRAAAYSVLAIGLVAFFNGVFAIRSPISIVMAVFAVFASSIISLKIKQYADRETLGNEE